MAQSNLEPTATSKHLALAPRPMGRARNGAAPQALGYLSVGLGLAELLAPRSVAELIGARNNARSRGVLRTLGARELAAGAGLLSASNATPWLWSRVLGDAMDLLLLGQQLKARRAQRGRLLAATAAIVGVTALDALIARRSAAAAPQKAIRVRRSITINRAPEEVYEFWRDLENLPRFMSHLESVRVTNGRSKWTAHGPAGISVSWDAEITLDLPAQMITWESVPGSTSVPNHGEVRFSPAPGNRGTEVHVALAYDPPAGVVGAAFAKLFGEEPSLQVGADLRRLKQVLETGEVVHSDASIHRGMHPGRPSAATRVGSNGGPK